MTVERSHKIQCQIKCRQENKLINKMLNNQGKVNRKKEGDRVYLISKTSRIFLLVVASSYQVMNEQEIQVINFLMIEISI